MKKQRSKFLLTGMTLIAGLQFATQFFALKANYHPALGKSFSGIYPPWKIVEWYLVWHERFPDQLMGAAGLGTVVAAVGLIAVIKTRRGKAVEKHK